MHDKKKKKFSESWYSIQKSMHQNAQISIGKKKQTNKNWFEENINVLLLLLKIKRQAHVDYQHDQVARVKRDPKRIEAELVQKTMLYCELVVGEHNRGRPKLLFKDVCKRDL